MEQPTPYSLDPWTHLRQHTAARIAIGRAGASLPTVEVLRFAHDHAQARDAVHAAFDAEALRQRLAGLGGEAVIVQSQATDRADYLKHPDHGRRLDDSSRERLQARSANPCDVVLIAADGLSARATQDHAVDVLQGLIPALRGDKISLGPVVIAHGARVALADEIGALLHARCAVILLGERPGLGSADSLGAYLVYDPRPGRTDAERNCVSNIRPTGLPPAEAARTLHYLLTRALERRLSGVHLKDERALGKPGSGDSQLP